MDDICQAGLDNFCLFSYRVTITDLLTVGQLQYPLTGQVRRTIIHTSRLFQSGTLRHFTK